MSKGCIYHILGNYQNELLHSIEEFKNILCNDLNAIGGQIIVTDTELKNFKNYSMVFYFDNISEKDLKIKLNEKFDGFKLAFIGHSEIVVIDI